MASVHILNIGTLSSQKMKTIIFPEEINEKEKVIYVDWGVANRFEDGTIELHKDLQLPEYYFLKEQILCHERAHDHSKGFWHNVKVDMFGFVGSKGLLEFMSTRPKTWVQILPLYWTKARGFIFDLNIMISYAIIAAGIWALIKLIGG